MFLSLGKRLTCSNLDDFLYGWGFWFKLKTKQYLICVFLGHKKHKDFPYKIETIYNIPIVASHNFCLRCYEVLDYEPELDSDVEDVSHDYP